MHSKCQSYLYRVHNELYACIGRTRSVPKRLSGVQVTYVGVCLAFSGNLSENDFYKGYTMDTISNYDIAST